MKNSYLFVLLVFALLFGACGAPDTKEAYLEKFEAFVEDVTRSYKSYSDEDWKKAVEKYEKFAGEWYDKFKDDFTIKEKLNITGYHTKFNVCRAMKKTATEIRELFESLDVNEIRKQIHYYIDNNMQDDLKKLVDEAGKAGKEAEKAVKEILKELNADDKKSEDKIEV